ncbi:MAG TPA: hypothetical protein VK530_15425 [Candidatus Acidoferrum sp.]|nr:hypothetical protein [Candidatus Acidoferrum sp.]
MKGIRFAALGGIVIACAIVAFFIMSREEEPAFEGKPLSHWLARLDSDPRTANVAITAMGSKATPFVIEELRAHDSSLEIWWRQFVRRQGWRWSYTMPATHRNRRAVRACMILRTHALLAVPHLEKLLHQAKTPDERNEIWLVLCRVEAPGTLVMFHTMTNGNPKLRSEARSVLSLNYSSGLSSNPTPVVTLLVSNLLHGSMPMRGHAAEALGWIGKLPDVTIPALGLCLNDPDEKLRNVAVASLGHFTRNTNAEHFVRTAFADRARSVRVAATNALTRLYPPPPISYE